MAVRRNPRLGKLLPDAGALAPAFHQPDGVRPDPDDLALSLAVGLGAAHQQRAVAADLLQQVGEPTPGPQVRAASSSKVNRVSGAPPRVRAASRRSASTASTVDKAGPAIVSARTQQKFFPILPEVGDRSSTETANEGADREVETGSTVTLSGSGSSTRANPAYSYAWTQTGGVSVTLDDATSATAELHGAVGAHREPSWRHAGHAAPLRSAA